jgi:glycosyltransferase involved in cell wall biosynthesis
MHKAVFAARPNAFMRVILIARYCPPLYSGAGRAALKLAKVLRDKGAEVTVLAGRFNNDMLEYETIDGVPIRRLRHSLRGRLPFYFRCAFWLYHNRQKYDVIHFREMPVYWFPVFIVSKVLKKPVVVTMTLYGSDDLASIRRNRLGALHLFFLLRVQKILAISNNLMQVSQKYIPDKKLITNINYLIDIRLFRPLYSSEERATLRAKYGICHKSKVVIFSGSVLYRKGIDLLVEAWPKVAQRLPNAVLYVVGPRTFRGEFGFTNQEFSRHLDMRIQTLGIESSIVFMGNKGNEIPEILRLADVFVLPSRAEGLPNALMEAMATGLPCIICDQPWVPKDLIRHGKSGLICLPMPELIADNILALLTNQNLAVRMGACARAYVEENHNPDNLSDRLVEVYKSTIQSWS